ncbi:Ykt6 protein [Guillardia theta CCMP2712]|uniref:Ykt6 protein n=1 Tax=Guillardia theta (strain CCMP2712) TaxID=905079 RepID=L1K2K2_GUITC|nr:Ykt6 protein [Guillardia theta CCMP2712]EKX54690.1 Ykt6 protein [Guillardia theta CCMP2712]|eukprot:XP_005841670.1 Ykt6 protein [Guillardia theta CCMP2712]
MKIHALSISRWKHADASIKEPVHLCYAVDVSQLSFFQRGTVKEITALVLRTCVAKTNPGDYQRLEHEGNYIYIICRHNGISGVCITDSEYPQRVAFAIITKLLDDFTEANNGKWSEDKNDNCMSFPDLEQALVKYQDPAEADKITKIQRELEETKQVLYNTIDAVLARGEKLDDLIDKSDSLSLQSKKFYKTAKKHNQCCEIM